MQGTIYSFRHDQIGGMISEDFFLTGLVNIKKEVT